MPADGIVRRGSSSLDLASLTGESVPVEVREGDQALAGAMNVDGLLQVELTRVGEESTVGRIIALMREAENAKPPVTRLLDRYAGQYMALVLLVAGGHLARSPPMCRRCWRCWWPPAPAHWCWPRRRPPWPPSRSPHATAS